MFSGEAEAQARRKTLSVLQDESRRVLDAARDFAASYPTLLKGDAKSIKEIAQRIGKAEDDVESLRRSLTRELAEIGTMVMNREDVLRAAYDIEEISGYITSAVFRLSHVKPQVLRKGLGGEIGELIEVAVQMVQRLNDVVRALTINPTAALDLAAGVQKLEREIDDKYRSLITKVMDEVNSVKDVILLKDILERIDGMADRCLAAADSVTILALGL